MHPILFALIAGLLVTFQPVHAATPATGADGIAAIVSDFDAFSRAQDPVRAAQRGDKAAARIWPDNSPSAVAARKTAYVDFQRRLQALPAAGLAGDDELNRELLVDRVSLALDGLAFDEERMPFISGDGFYTTADYAALNTPLDDEAAADSLDRAARGTARVLRARDREHASRHPHGHDATDAHGRARHRRRAWPA